MQLDEEKCNFYFFEDKHLLDFDQLYDDPIFESIDGDKELGTKASNDQLKLILQKEMVQEMELKEHGFKILIRKRRQNKFVF